MSKVVSITGEAIDIAAACNRQLAKCNHSISNGAVAKISGVPVSEIKDQNNDSLYLDVMSYALPLTNGYVNAQRIIRAALNETDLEARSKALRAVAEILKFHMDEHNRIMALLKDDEREDV